MPLKVKIDEGFMMHIQYTFIFKQITMLCSVIASRCHIFNSI